MGVVQAIGRMIAKAFLVLAAGGGTGLLVYTGVLPRAWEVQYIDYRAREFEQQRAIIAAVGAGLLASAAVTVILLIVGWLMRSVGGRRDRVHEQFADVKPAEWRSHGKPLAEE